MRREIILNTISHRIYYKIQSNCHSENTVTFTQVAQKCLRMVEHNHWSTRMFAISMINQAAYFQQTKAYFQSMQQAAYFQRPTAHSRMRGDSQRAIEGRIT